MKPLSSFLFALLLAGALAGLAGCAGTPSSESTGEFIDGSGITAKVKAAFIRDPLVKAFDVKVETFKGTVQLAGFVDTAEQKARAGELARAVPGVTDVKNNISLKVAAAK
jgi:osmotically-inducible protein OsmY